MNFFSKIRTFYENHTPNRFFFANIHNVLHFFVEHPVFFLFCNIVPSRGVIETKFLDGSVFLQNCNHFPYSGMRSTEEWLYAKMPALYSICYSGQTEWSCISLIPLSREEKDFSIQDGTFYVVRSKIKAKLLNFCHFSDSFMARSHSNWISSLILMYDFFLSSSFNNLSARANLGSRSISGSPIKLILSWSFCALSNLIKKNFNYG